MAAPLRQGLVNIQPYVDGDGRTSRLVMNLPLLRNGYPIAIVDSEMEKRQKYYCILSEYRGVADGDSNPFECLIAKKMKEALFEYLYFLSSDSYSRIGRGRISFSKKSPPFPARSNLTEPRETTPRGGLHFYLPYCDVPFASYRLPVHFPGSAPRVPAIFCIPEVTILHLLPGAPGHVGSG